MQTLLAMANELKKAGLLTQEISDLPDRPIADISYDSREIRASWLFFCKGARFRPAYLEEAARRGAAAYVSEKFYPDVTIPCLCVRDVRKAMLLLAAFFYEHPDRSLKIIGVTGTKGKSSTVQFIKSILDCRQARLGRKPCGIISSIHIYDGETEGPNPLTTPEAIPLYRHLATAVRRGLDYLVLEISSQALKYDRVGSMRLVLALFLNIGRDHISPVEHPDFQDYLESKLKILDLAPVCIYKKDMGNDTVQKRLAESGKRARTFSCEDEGADYLARSISWDGRVNRFLCRHDGTETRFELRAPGDYNVENALAAIAAADERGVTLEDCRQGLKACETEGRSRMFSSRDGRLSAMVDYAHNALSFRRVFHFVRQNYPLHYLVVIYGCVGGKALNRVHDLSVEAMRYADEICIVPDDSGEVPYREIAASLRNELRDWPKPWAVYGTREEAICEAFREADKARSRRRTFILAAGKGAEAYLYMDGKIIPTPSDLTLVQREMAAYERRHPDTEHA